MVHTITVSQLNRYIKRVLDNDVNISNIIIKGEISNFKRHYSGHCYLTLKDEGGAVRAVMFRNNADALPFEPENGMKVLAQGKVSVYERDGTYQLYIESMQPDGVGALNLAFEQLKQKLSEEGLFSEERKKPIPHLPKTIGVVTASTGAAVRDIIQVITRRCKMPEILIYPVLVQGDEAAGQISKAIAWFNKEKAADVLIVGRGGGSLEDLWAFNMEETARAIAESEIPVISAVGHETDFTIADFVADLRAPTPSAAAELAVPSSTALLAEISQNQSRMIYATNKTISGYRELLKRLSVKKPTDQIFQNRQRLDDLTKYVIHAEERILEMKKNQFRLACGRLETLSPLKVMSRGYAAIKSKEKPVRSATDVKTGDDLTLQLRDGKISAKVEEVVQNG